MGWAEPVRDEWQWIWRALDLAGDVVAAALMLGFGMICLMALIGLYARRINDPSTRAYQAPTALSPAWMLPHRRAAGG